MSGLMPVAERPLIIIEPCYAPPYDQIVSDEAIAQEIAQAELDELVGGDESWNNNYYQQQNSFYYGTWRPPPIPQGPIFVRDDPEDLWVCS